MKIVLGVYTTDANHPKTNMKLIALCTTHKKVITAIKKHIEANYLDELSDDDCDNLCELKKTKGRTDDYVIDEIFLNELFL